MYWLVLSLIFLICSAELPPHWTQHTHQGKVYYYNSVTGVSQWEPPVPVGQSEIPPVSIPPAISRGSRFARQRKPHRYELNPSNATKSNTTKDTHEGVQQRSSHAQKLPTKALSSSTIEVKNQTNVNLGTYPVRTDVPLEEMKTNQPEIHIESKHEDHKPLQQKIQEASIAEELDVKKKVATSYSNEQQKDNLSKKAEIKKNEEVSSTTSSLLEDDSSNDDEIDIDEEEDYVVEEEEEVFYHTKNEENEDKGIIKTCDENPIILFLSIGKLQQRIDMLEKECNNLQNQLTQDHNSLGTEVSQDDEITEKKIILLKNELEKTKKELKSSLNELNEVKKVCDDQEEEIAQAQLQIEKLVKGLKEGVNDTSELNLEDFESVTGEVESFSYWDKLMEVCSSWIPSWLGFHEKKYSDIAKEKREERLKKKEKSKKMKLKDKLKNSNNQTKADSNNNDQKNETEDDDDEIDINDSEKMKQLKISNEELQDKLSSLEMSLEARGDVINELTSQLDEYFDENEKRMAEFNSLKDGLMSLDSEHSSISLQLEEREEQLNILRKSCKILQEQKTSLEDEIIDIKKSKISDQQKLQQELNCANATITQLRAYCNSLQLEVVNKEKDLSLLNSSLSTSLIKQQQQELHINNLTRSLYDQTRAMAIAKVEAASRVNQNPFPAGVDGQVLNDSSDGFNPFDKIVSALNWIMKLLHLKS